MSNCVRKGPRWGTWRGVHLLGLMRDR